MRSLLWKDYRQNRGALLAAVLVAAGPYLVAVVIIIAQRVVGAKEAEEWLQAITAACYASIWISVMIAAFMGAAPIAGERADRSAEFVAGLPIDRANAVFSKAIVTGLPCLALWAANTLALTLLMKSCDNGRPPNLNENDLVAAITWSFLLALLLFGMAWLFSSLMRSPAMAAAAAIGTVTGLATAVSMLSSWDGYQRVDDSMVILLIALCIGLGLMSFLTGVLVCLRRLEP